MQNKTIKFFISSTFKDFIKERNALQNFVFPRLKKLCQDKGFSFQPVDLRWGVTNESSDDNKTMEYCLNEVKRCSSDPKPNLLILFGQRYGWVPLPSYIESNVFDIIEEKIDNINFTKELFEKEKEEWNKEATKEKKKKELLNNIDEANKYIFKNFKLKDLLKEWYIKDLNDKNQKYYLKDKRNTPTLIWRFIEKILKTYIQKVDDTKEKNNYDIFHTSATEQEIKLALKKQKVLESKNTIVYYRKFKNDTIDKDFIEEEQNEKLEKLEKYLSDNKSCSLIKKDSIDLDIYKSLKDEYISIETKSHEEKNYPKDIPEYLEDFCESVYNEFKDKINTEIDKYNDDFPTTLKIELEQQERFLKSKYFYYIDERNERKDINDVIGRNKELKEIVNFITDSENTEQYYLLYGKSGTGKTSVMAKALTEIKNKNNKYDIYYRFIGTTAYSTYSRQVFESIYREIESKLSNNENLPKVEFEIEELKFKKQFQELLQRLDDKKVVIFLDAIDQFEDDNDLSILLDDLPKNIKIIFSVLYDENKTDNNDYTKYYEKLSNIKNNTKLDILDQSFNIEILKQLLEKDNRTLSTNKDNNQQNLVESFIEDQTPLCVKLTYEIVREWTSNEDIDELKEELPSIDCENKEEELIIKFFNNVIKKYYVNEELLNFTLGLISASKDGLSETELIDIISNEEKILKSYDKDQRYQQLNKLPDAIFSKMYYHIQDIFTEKLIDGEMLINPYHRVIEEVIKNYFYKINKNQLHKKLSDYFYLKQDKTKTWNKRYHNLHMLSEYPYQLFHSKQSKELKEILFDLEFAGSIYDNNKQTSFRDTMSKATQLDNISEDEIYPWESFYREKEHLILKVNEELWRPHQSLFQLAYEDGLDSSVTEKAKLLLNNKKEKQDIISWKFLRKINQKEYYTRIGLEKVVKLRKKEIIDIKTINKNFFIVYSDNYIEYTDYKFKVLKEFKSKKIEILNESKFISYSEHDYEVWDHTLNKLAFEENNLNKESTTSILLIKSINNRKFMILKNDSVEIYENFKIYKSYIINDLYNNLYWNEMNKNAIIYNSDDCNEYKEFLIVNDCKKYTISTFLGNPYENFYLENKLYEELELSKKMRGIFWFNNNLVVYNEFEIKIIDKNNKNNFGKDCEDSILNCYNIFDLKLIVLCKKNILIINNNFELDFSIEIDNDIFQNAYEFYKCIILSEHKIIIDCNFKFYFLDLITYNIDCFFELDNSSCRLNVYDEKIYIVYDTVNILVYDINGKCLEDIFIDINDDSLNDFIVFNDEILIFTMDGYIFKISRKNNKKFCFNNRVKHIDQLVLLDKFVVSHSYDGKIQLWNKNELIQTINMENNYILGIEKQNDKIIVYSNSDHEKSFITYKLDNKLNILKEESKSFYEETLNFKGKIFTININQNIKFWQENKPINLKYDFYKLILDFKTDRTILGMEIINNNFIIFSENKIWIYNLNCEKINYMEFVKSEFKIRKIIAYENNKFLCFSNDGQIKLFKIRGELQTENYKIHLKENKSLKGSYDIIDGIKILNDKRFILYTTDGEIRLYSEKFKLISNLYLPVLDEEIYNVFKLKNDLNSFIFLYKGGKIFFYSDTECCIFNTNSIIQQCTYDTDKNIFIGVNDGIISYYDANF